MGRAQRAMLVTVAVLLAAAMGAGGCGPGTNGPVALNIVLPPGQRTAEGAFPYAREAVLQWCHSHRQSDKIVPTSVEVDGHLDAVLAGRYSVTYRFQQPADDPSDYYVLFHVYADVGGGRLTKIEVDVGESRDSRPEITGYPGKWVSMRRAVDLAEARAQRGGVHIAHDAWAHAETWWGYRGGREVQEWFVEFTGKVGPHRRLNYLVWVTSGGRVEMAQLYYTPT